MKTILLIGHGPKVRPQTTVMGFPQLRTWSIEQFLGKHNYEVHTVLVPSTIEDRPLSIPSIHFDAIVTAGPFASAYAALSLPTNIPLWLDWPSDPRADLHARLHHHEEIPSTEEQAFVAMLHSLALRRADAIGVISKRQYWATLSSLMDRGLHEVNLASRVHTIPIAFDFPFPHSLPFRGKEYNITLCGSLNAWFDIHAAQEILGSVLETRKNVHVHICGGTVDHNKETTPLTSWRHNRVHIHDWLPQQQLQDLLSKQDLGFWMNHKGIEPLLGSRTRALLFAWMHMDIAASCDTELMHDLLSKNLVHDIREANDLHNVIESPPNKGSQLFAYCQEQYAPEKVYAPLLDWLSHPQKRTPLTQEILQEEIFRLRAEMNTIYATPTWRWGSRLHSLGNHLRKKLLRLV